MKFPSFILTGVVLLLLDCVYFSVSKSFFNNQIKQVQGSSIKLSILPAFLCYVMLAFGINYFIIAQNKSYTDAFLLGFTVYAVYELTNKALLLNWHWLTVLIDSLWGGILFASTTYIVKYIESYL